MFTSVPVCASDEGTYQLSQGERGSKVVFVVSEPITASTSDWVQVPTPVPCHPSSSSTWTLT